MNLYQWSFGCQPHYVIAEDLGDAERVIKQEYDNAIERIDCLGPYVQVSERCCPCRKCVEWKEVMP